MICFWAIGLVLGWALIYLPHYPQDYVIAEGTAPHAPLVGALHASLTTVTTLGSANIVPKPAWLQLLSPIEALIGFGMLTAAVSWLLQIYPVLSRRRALAYEIHLLADTERRLELERRAARDVGRRGAVRRADVAPDRGRARPREVPDHVLLRRDRPALRARRRDAGAGRDRRARTSAERPDAVRLRAEMLREAVERSSATTVVERFVLRPPPRRRRRDPGVRARSRPRRRGRGARPRAQRPRAGAALTRSAATGPLGAARRTSPGTREQGPPRALCRFEGTPAG